MMRHTGAPSIPQLLMEKKPPPVTWCHPHEPLRTSAAFWADCEDLPERIKAMFDNQHASLFLRKKGSRGRQKNLSADQKRLLRTQVASLEKAGIIEKSTRTAFISYPFFIPKADGSLRMIVDMGHLRQGYRKPALYLPSFAAVLRQKTPIKQGQVMARIDLRDAFYSVPLPAALKPVTAFRVDSKTYVFNGLPMGLFASPVLLQHTVMAALSRVKCWWWVHMDDILLVANTIEELHKATQQAIRGLHTYGFNINTRKLALRAKRIISYCGLVIDTTRMSYDISQSKQKEFQRFLQQGQPTLRALGMLAYWCYVAGLSSGFRALLRPSQAHRLWRYIASGPWPMPRPQKICGRLTRQKK